MDKIKIGKEDQCGKDEIYCMFYRCPSCKCQDIIKDFKYCPECGKGLDWVEPE